MDESHKETVIDNGGFYSFPNPQPKVKMEPGKYYPGYSNSHGFILHKNKRRTVREKVEEKAAHINSKLSGDQNPVPKNKKVSENTSSLDSPDGKEDVFKEDYSSSKYFPMEKYNSGLNEADSSIKKFISNKQFFEDNNLDYKRSILLFSEPGTGKTWFIRNTTDRLIKSENAIVINIESHAHLDYISEGMQTIDRTLHDRLKIIVIEELAEFCRDSSSKTKALQLLDSPFFRENMLFLVTTNEPGSIPQNLIDRPSRLDVLSHISVEAFSDDFIPAWYKHNTGKELDDKVKEQSWYVDAKSSLTPVYWAELFKFSELQQISLKEAWENIKERKELIGRAFSTGSAVGF